MKRVVVFMGILCLASTVAAGEFPKGIGRIIAGNPPREEPVKKEKVLPDDLGRIVAGNPPREKPAKKNKAAQVVTDELVRTMLGLPPAPEKESPVRKMDPEERIQILIGPPPAPQPDPWHPEWKGGLG